MTSNRADAQPLDLTRGSMKGRTRSQTMMFFRRRPEPTAVLDLRPRFLPDPEVHTEWGFEGEWLSRLIRRGFKIPPTAAWGASQVDTWLKGFPSYGVAVENWRLWGNPYSASDWESVPAALGHLADLRDQILSAPMPFHFARAVHTLQEMLCGGQSWPLQLRIGVNDLSPVIENPDAYSVWCAFRELVALQFSLERAGQRLERLEDPRGLMYPVLIQPVLNAEVSARGADEEATALLPKTIQEELRIHLGLADRLSPGRVEMDWAWDGEQLWFKAAGLAVSAAPSTSKLIPLFQTGDSKVSFSHATASVFEEAVKEAQGPLQSRFGLSISRLRSALVFQHGKLWLNSAAIRPVFSFSFKRLIRDFSAFSRLVVEWVGGQPRHVAVAEYRLARALSRLSPVVNSLRREMALKQERDDIELRTWLQSWPMSTETRSTDVLGQRLSEIRDQSKATLPRWMAVLVTRELLIEALAPLIDLSAEEMRDANRLNSDWSEVLAIVHADPAVAEFIDALARRERRPAERLGASARDRWTKFLERHGHLHSTPDLRSASWSEDASVFADKFRSQNPELVPGRPHGRSVRRAGVVPALASIAQVEWALELTRELTRFLETLIGSMSELQSASRHVFLGGGDALVRKQFLRHRDDAFLLGLSELVAAFAPDAMTVRFMAERRRFELRLLDHMAAERAVVEGIPTGLTRNSAWLREKLSSLTASEMA